MGMGMETRIGMVMTMLRVMPLFEDSVPSR